MNKRYMEFKLSLLDKYPNCEVCGSQASQVNHVLYHKHGKKVADAKIYDTFENCQSCCPQCNCGYKGNGNSRATKMGHWKKRESEGYDMENWNEQVSKYRREGFGE